MQCDRGVEVTYSDEETLLLGACDVVAIATHLLLIEVVILEVRDHNLHDEAKDQSRAKDDGKVDGEGRHAAVSRTIADILCDEGEVEEGGVRVNELEEEDLHNKTIFELKEEEEEGISRLDGV